MSEIKIGTCVKENELLTTLPDVINAGLKPFRYIFPILLMAWILLNYQRRQKTLSVIQS